MQTIHDKYESVVSNDKTKEVVKDANETVKTGLHAVHERADPILKELKENLKPITDRLPASVNHFLDSGGWWLVIGLLSVVFFFWAKSLWNKLKRSFRKGNPNKKKLLISSEKWAAGELVEDLSKMTPPINRPGKDRVTVKGISSRIFLIIMAKAGGAGPDLSEDQSEAIRLCIIRARRSFEQRLPPSASLGTSVQPRRIHPDIQSKCKSTRAQRN